MRSGVQGVGFGVWSLGFGFWGSGFGFWVLGFGFWGFGFWVWGFGFWVCGLGLRVEVYSLGFRVQGLGLPSPRNSRARGSCPARASWPVRIAFCPYPVQSHTGHPTRVVRSSYKGLYPQIPPRHRSCQLQRRVITTQGDARFPVHRY